MRPQGGYSLLDIYAVLLPMSKCRDYGWCKLVFWRRHIGISNTAWWFLTWYSEQRVEGVGERKMIDNTEGFSVWIEIWYIQLIICQYLPCYYVFTSQVGLEKSNFILKQFELFYKQYLFQLTNFRSSVQLDQLIKLPRNDTVHFGGLSISPGM